MSPDIGKYPLQGKITPYSLAYSMTVEYISCGLSSLIHLFFYLFGTVFISTKQDTPDAKN